MMIVLTIEQAAYLRKVASEQRQLFPTYVDVVPVAIKNSLFILPVQCLEDPNFAVFAKWLGDDLNSLVIREVQPDEYIEPLKITINENLSD